MRSSADQTGAVRISALATAARTTQRNVLTKRPRLLVRVGISLRVREEVFIEELRGAASMRSEAPMVGISRETAYGLTWLQLKTK
jgi:hypothetical protein